MTAFRGSLFLRPAPLLNLVVLKSLNGAATIPRVIKSSAPPLIATNQQLTDLQRCVDWMRMRKRSIAGMTWLAFIFASNGCI
jgi:hypothetical protein